MKTFNQVCHSLANLIRWADQILLQGDQSVNREDAYKVIDEVTKGVEVSWGLGGRGLPSKPRVYHAYV